MLVNGKWSADWQPVQNSDSEGRFIRQISSFRNEVSNAKEARYPAQQGRYHLYAAAICPWANRALITRSLKGLENVVSVSIVEPFLGEQGWRFGDYPGSMLDAVNGLEYMHELYTHANANYTGRATVPVLWDKQTNTLVNNESADIVRIFNQGFGELANNIDLYPDRYRAEIDTLNARLYKTLNNGVYRAGFATTQTAYEEAVTDVFDMLEWLDQHLSNHAHIVGNQLTETDIRAFVTLVRFEPAYYGLFKCNLKHLWQYDHVWAYLQRLYAVPAFHRNVNFDHIKQGYYSIKALNPNGIVPVGNEVERLITDISKVA